MCCRVSSIIFIISRRNRHCTARRIVNSQITRHIRQLGSERHFLSASTAQIFGTKVQYRMRARTADTDQAIHSTDCVSSLRCFREKREYIHATDSDAYSD